MLCVDFQVMCRYVDKRDGMGDKTRIYYEYLNTTRYLVPRRLSWGGEKGKAVKQKFLTQKKKTEKKLKAQDTPVL